MRYILIKYNERNAARGHRINLFNYLRNEFDNDNIKCLIAEGNDVEDMLHILREFQSRHTQS